MLCRKITGRSRSDAFDSRFNGRLILRQLTNPNFTWRELLKMIPAVREIFPFSNCVVFTCRGTSWIQ